MKITFTDNITFLKERLLYSVKDIWLYNYENHTNIKKNIEIKIVYIF